MSPDLPRHAGAVVVIGSINVDLTIRVPHIPLPGETVLGGDVQRAWGGKGANQSVAAAASGSTVCLVGAVGDDDAGKGSMEALRSAEVDTEFVRVTDRPTGLASIVVDPAGENAITVSPGANLAVSVPGSAEVAKVVGDAPGIVLVSFEITDDAVREAARLAVDLKWQLVVNPAPARTVPTEVLESHPVLVPNQGEAEVLTRSTDPTEAALQLSAVTGAPVVVTCGAGGAVVCAEGIVSSYAAPSVEVVDSTGAGDAFTGTLAAVLASGASVDDAVRAAIDAGAAAVSRPGARPQIDKAETR